MVGRTVNDEALNNDEEVVWTVDWIHQTNAHAVTMEG